MRYFFLIVLILGCSACSSIATKQVTFANNPVIAHRGAWKAKNLPENSIAALKQAIELGCTGSEFDVRMTLDSILIVTHDPDYQGLIIEENTYATLAEQTLTNGETLPTLKDYILAGMDNNPGTGLVCELKPSKIEGRNVLMAEKAVALVAELNAEPYISYYISFSYEILQKIIALNPTAKTQYLDGSKSPEVLHNDSISGLDYAVHILKRKPEWIQEAKDKNLKLNAWTANSQEDLDWLIANNFDYITTNEPELLFERLKTSPSKNGWHLVWSDEFNYTGKPDTTKWGYDYRFIANQEKQYYTDSLKNARVEKGHLILEAHKEKIANKDFKNTEISGWAKYKTEIDTAQYTSARIKTEGLAAWQYGRIEVSAKLPEGRGMWPAIWMLSEDRKEIGWPESGEIDIMEHVGYDNDTIHGTIHTKAYNHMLGTQKGKSTFIENPNDEFHVFAIEWTPQKIDFMVDDVVYNQVKNEGKTSAEWPFDKKFYLILNVAVGGMWGGQKGIDDTIFPQQMIIDYIRVYQQAK
ncbi:family 16 glycosylhydrolase [Cellulophaga sp. Hel_I_12]|uniref:family 16 glycosylhydrolase n=1 Tax=Cellulophaga sp. Hel_I_12 TaxID=1249972 RepID=UPI000646FD07|nr:family 16 glycosylhydrolase [Cellulophaga sp. Hel_I_12]